MSGARAPGPAAGAAGDEPPGAALSVDVAGLLAQLARSFALLLPVYALGYLGLSFSWVLLALGLLVWCRRSRGLKATRLCRALALLEDEERSVRLGVRACDLPAWSYVELIAWWEKVVFGGQQQVVTRTQVCWVTGGPTGWDLLQPPRAAPSSRPGRSDFFPWNQSLLQGKPQLMLSSPSHTIFILKLSWTLQEAANLLAS